jgi:sporulation protein YqfC
MARRDGVGRVVGQWLDLGADVLGGLPRVTVVGREEVFVTGHEGLARYAPEEVRIRTRMGPVVVRGRGLWVAQVTSESVRLRGEVHAVAVGP